MSVTEKEKLPASDSLPAFFQQLDTGIPAFTWSQQDSVLLHYLQFLDFFYLVEVPKLVARHGKDAEAAIESRTACGAAYIIRWICDPSRTKGQSNLTIGPISQEEINQFADAQYFAVDYSECRDWENSIYEGFCAAEAVSDLHMKVRRQNDVRLRGEAFEWLMKKMHNQLAGSQFDPAPLVATAFTGLVFPDRFSVPDYRIDEYLAASNPRFNGLWRMDPDSSFDTFSLADLRKFWFVVYAMADIQLNLARQSSPFPFQKVILRHSYDSWLSKITTASKLDIAKVQSILNYFIYEPNEPAKSDAALQPFFRLADGQVILSNTLVRFSNIEDNFVALYIRKFPSEYGTVASQKEKWWIGHKKPEIAAKGYDVRGPFVFSNAQGKNKGDIDLFILDRKTGIALCCQFKWLLIPDRFQQSNMDRVLKGVRQAVDAIEWLKLDPDRAQATLGIRKKFYKNITLLPLLVSRDWMLNGLDNCGSVPIVSEVLLDCLLERAPSENPLLSIWECLKQGTYLPVIDEDFSLETKEIKRSGVILEYDSLTAISGKEWSPDNIHFPSLTVPPQ